MIKLFQVVGVLSLFIGSNMAMAGTIIKIQADEELTTVLTDGKLVRMNISSDEYVIVDYRKQTVKIVSPQKQQVMLLGTNKMVAGNPGPEVRASFKKLGAGIKIAGYPTQKYTYSANGKSCGVIYGSKEAYQQPGIKQLFLAMQTMMENQRAAMGGFAGMMDDCDLADMKVGEHVNTIGVPMRTEVKGVVDSEIKSIRLNENVPADTFVIPASYKTITIEQQMREAKQQLQQYGLQNQQPQMQQMPQIQEMMGQMQQSGQMTPEMMEQMRQVQEMMRQYQTPQ